MKYGLKSPPVLSSSSSKFSLSISNVDCTNGSKVLMIGKGRFGVGRNKLHVFFISMVFFNLRLEYA